MFYSLEKTAEILEMNPGDVNRLREQGKLRAFRDGAVWKFRKEDVEKFLTNMIKERSANAADDLLSSENDEEGPTMLADSSAFDTMFDAAADAVVVSAQDSGLSLTKEDDDLKLADDDLKLADDDADFQLADDDDDLKLADSTPLTDSASALVEDAASESESPSAVDLTADAVKSDDDLLHLGSDSGLALLDEPDVDGSNISLGDDDDLVLGGGSSSGSGSGLDLSGDSGLALLGDSDADFQLDESASEKLEEASKEESDDDGIFELADEANSAPVLNLDKEADTEAPTELGVAADDSIFDLVDSSVQTETSDDSESASASQMINVDADPFHTDEEGSTPVEESAADSLFDPGDALADPFMTTTSDPVASTPASTVDSDPFNASSAPADSASAGFGDSVDAFGGASAGFGDASDAFGGVASSDFGASSPVDSMAIDEPADEPVAAAPVASTNFVGKDMLLLVPCLILLILATIGAWELCRTIWSYQEGSFDFGGPVLETIAKMVKLI